MFVSTFLGDLPGQRIVDYRNSAPRTIKVLGIGHSAREIVESFTAAHRDNVIASQELDPHRQLTLDEPVNGVRPNAVVVVYQAGEEVKFPFLTDRTAAMLSFIVLEPQEGGPDATENRKIRDIQSIADLYVTTSDREFVNELVSNLAS